MSEPQPIYASGYFFVRETGLVEEIIEFCYFDPNELYVEILGSLKKLRREKEKLARNMQAFLDAEEVYINDVRVYPRVIDVDIGLREDNKHPYIMFFIVFAGTLKPGINTYEDRYEPVEAEYDYRVVWVFPSKSRIIHVDIGVPYIVFDHGRGLIFKVNKGTKIKGYERIDFELLI